MNLFSAKSSTSKIDEETTSTRIETREPAISQSHLATTESPLMSATNAPQRMPSTPSAPMSSATEPGPSAVVGSKITFKGELSGDEDLLIQGYVEGTISLKGNQLTIGRLGKVKANISAKSIIVDGHVEGDMVAEEHIAINAQSLVKGNISAERVTLEDGAKFRGSIDMNLDEKPFPSLKSDKPAITPKENLEPA